MTLHELIGHRLFQLLLGLHRGRTIFYSGSVNSGTET